MARWLPQQIPPYDFLEQHIFELNDLKLGAELLTFVEGQNLDRLS